MRMSWLVCVLLGTLAWGQSAPGTPPLAPSPDASASVLPDAAVLTINGVCPPQPKAATSTAAKPAAPAKAPAAKPPTADCKTVITRAQFEKVAGALVPNMTPQQKKQLETAYPKYIAMSTQAKKKGLDKSPHFKETLRFAEMQILSNELQRSIQEDAAKVSPEEIATYYKEHPENFEQYNLDRLFVPHTKQEDAEAKEEEPKEEKLTEEQQKAKQAEEKAKADAAEQTMNKLALALRDRAAAGEDIAKLQKEAFEAGGMKIESPTVNLPKVRHNGLPPAHAAVFELKVGEVSPVIADSGGHYIYKVNSKDLPALDQVKDEIRTTLQQQHTREAMEKLNGSFTVVPNEAYFGPAGARPMPPNRVPNPHMAPGPMGPARGGPGGIGQPPVTQPPTAQPPTPPSAQPPTAKPN